MAIGELGWSSDVHYSDMMVQLVRILGVSSYLELGVWTGTTLNKIEPLVEHCTGVDLVDRRDIKHPKTLFIEGTTDYFFETRGKSFLYDLIFIDAEHGFEPVKKDFENSLKILAKRGLILLHDTDPISKFYTNPGMCSDSWKIVDYILVNRPELSIITLPVNEAGLSIVSRKADRRIINAVPPQE